MLDSDVGLWVVDDGSMDLAGAARLPWTLAVGDVPAGVDAIEVRDDPAGWQVGDEIVLTPTTPPTTEGHAEAYDVRTIASIDGRTIGLADPVTHDHPAIASARETFPPAEVLNLTRNVQIEGTPEGRAHVFIRSNSPQSIRHVQIRHVGPRRPAADATEPVLGRYGLHFHMSHEGSRGSLVEGVVVRECGNHAFVPHMSQRHHRSRLRRARRDRGRLLVGSDRHDRRPAARAVRRLAGAKRSTWARVRPLRFPARHRTEQRRAELHRRRRAGEQHGGRLHVAGAPGPGRQVPVDVRGLRRAQQPRARGLRLAEHDHGPGGGRLPGVPQREFRDPPRCVPQPLPLSRLRPVRERGVGARGPRAGERGEHRERHVRSTRVRRQRISTTSRSRPAITRSRP